METAPDKVPSSFFWINDTCPPPAFVCKKPRDRSPGVYNASFQDYISVMTYTMPPACSDALLALAPAYFTMSADEQDQWRASLTTREDNLYKTLQHHLLVHGLGMDSKKAAKHLNYNSKKRLKGKKLDWLNQHMIHLTGVGVDRFSLNEFLGDGKTILDYPTLYHYDYADFLFQETARHEQFSIPPKTQYNGSLHATWARLLIEGTLSYLSLSMLASHVLFALEEMEYTMMEDAIPHSYDNGPNHMKKVQGGFQFDLVLNANGRETLYEDMRKASQAYIQERFDQIAQEQQARAANTVWIVEQNSLPGEKNHTAVFSDPTALHVRFTHFLEDCGAKAGDPDVLKNLVEREKDAYKTWFETTLAQKDA